MNATPHPLAVIATISTPFKEKFAVPRQPGLAPAAQGQIHFNPPYDHPDYCREISQFSHLWLLFQFHLTSHKPASALVRPPRLGGNKKVGVFASRSTHRPNNLGMSVVTLDKVVTQAGTCVLHVSGVDLVDGTPIVDIKPYIDYSDNVCNATSGYAQAPPSKHLDVTFSADADHTLQQLNGSHPDFKLLIVQVLQQDPRPAYHDAPRQYGMRLFDFNVTWQVNENIVDVIDIAKI